MKSSSQDKVDAFFARFKSLHFKKGKTILRAGEEPRDFFYLKKGFIRLYSLSKNGEDLTLIIFKPKDLFPIMWAINNTPSDYFLEAMTPVELWRAPKSQFLAFIHQNPDVLFGLTSAILERLGGLLARMEYLVFGNAYAKVASILVICARRFGKKEDSSVIIEVPLTHSDIASLIGVTRETASIEIKKIENKGLLSRRGHLFVIKNLTRLKNQSLLNSNQE